MKGDEVLVEEIAEELAHAQVGPASMHQQEALQELELGKGVVRGQHRLDPFLPTDAHTNVAAAETRGDGKMKTPRASGPPLPSSLLPGSLSLPEGPAATPAQSTLTFDHAA